MLQGLRTLGYIEGQNFVIEGCHAEGRFERLPELTAEHATQTIPIIMAFIGDPVAEGLIESFTHPGGNITGLAFRYPELTAKRLQLLKKAVHNMARLAILFNPTYPGNPLLTRETQVEAQALGVTLQRVEVRDPSAFDNAFAAMTRKRADTLFVLVDALLFTHRRRIADVAIKSRLPAIFEQREQAEVGGLMSYGATVPDDTVRLATYVDKILKGAKPADLPVEQPTTFELVINLKTAKALGLTMPPTLLFQADEVIR